MNRDTVRSCAIILAILCSVSCARGDDAQAPQPLIPDTPDGTIEVVARHLAEHDPGIVWEALPASYRADIDDLTAQFAAKMDAELYNRSFALLRSAVEVLQDKQALILGSETVTGTGIDVEQLERGTTSGLAAMHVLLTSRIVTLEGLAGIDWKVFLDTTGAQLLQVADNAAGDENLEEDPFAALRELSVETVNVTDDRAVVRVTSGERPPEEIELTRVEGRWMPSELVEKWPEHVAEARAGLDELTPEQIAEIKPQAMMGLAMAEGIVQQVAAVETSEDFDAMMGPMVESVMGSLAILAKAAPSEPDTEPEE
jgi:hypothetical protein